MKYQKRKQLNLNQSIRTLKTETDEKLEEKAVKSELIDSYTQTETDEILEEKAVKSELIDSYTQTETDEKLEEKAVKSELIDSYTQTETDEILKEKAVKSELIDSYTQTETDEKLEEKAVKSELIDSYTQTETDEKLEEKAVKSELIDSYIKTETDEKLDIKANAADIVYSSLKSEGDLLLLLKADKTELIVVQIKSETYAREEIYTKSEYEALLLLKTDKTDLMNYVDLTSAQTISGQKDNQYTVVKEVADYWRYETDLKILETELYYMSNVITTLGAATGGGNAITDISIDGKTLAPQRNTIYDFNTVFLVDYGVKTISDINAISYTKSEDDALLLLKAGKTQLIDSCSKSETYARDEVITKTETNNLLNNKTDNGISYSKDEDNELLLLKADKIQLIDSCSKIETYTKDEVFTKN
ncbi:MAG: hypothetical protein EZS28_016327 [Streblomastix strix]|uniref:Uncharacterized protein n=1 Tax=Streblomastix strix TaxID=222440 RepID=A0A5J4W0U8_9EUKA|nr:MAG: hypothetical protein EZS28_016327 [Streblomastix strix]